MIRRLLRPSFAHAGGGGRFGGLVPTLGAGTTIQVLVTFAGFVTIPIIVTALGSSSFGILVVVVSLAPWLFLVDGALQTATRLLVGESRTDHRNTANAALLHSTSRLAVKIAVINLAVLALGLVVMPLVSLFGADGVATRQELALAVLCFAIPVIASGPGGVYLGALEGVGRTVVAVVISGIGPLIALPATIIVVWAGGGLIELCAVQGLSVAAPRYCAWAYWRLRPSVDEPKTDGEEAPRLRFALVFQMVVLGAAIYVQSGLDPVIVSSQLDAAAAGSFGLASRLVNGALIPLVVITACCSPGTSLLPGGLAGARQATATCDAWSCNRRSPAPSSARASWRWVRGLQGSSERGRWARRSTYMSPVGPSCSSVSSWPPCRWPLWARAV